MRLKNILIVVQNVEQSKQFYRDLFGLDVILDQEKNVMLTEGLVLQEKEIWEQCLNQSVVAKSNSCELYFETMNLEEFAVKLERLFPSIEYVTPLTEYEWGQKVVRFYDLDGNLIEVRTPVNQR